MFFLWQQFGTEEKYFYCLPCHVWNYILAMWNIRWVNKMERRLILLAILFGLLTAYHIDIDAWKELQNKIQDRYEQSLKQGELQ